MKKVLLTALLPLLLGSCNQIAALQRGCESSYKVPNFAALDADLAAAQTKWAAAGIKNYTYTTNSGFSGLVSGKGAVSVSGSTVTPAGAYTMEKWFSEVKSLIDSARAADSCTVVSASYDSTDGHLLDYSWMNTKAGLVDAFGGYSITSFRKD